MNTGKKTQNDRSLRELVGVHKRLAMALVQYAADPTCTFQFVITDGLRTDKEQAVLVTRGASQTLNSKHLKGRAVDICIFLNGKPRWEFALYKAFAQAFMKYASTHHDLDLVWGGNWKSLRDGPHFELKDDVP